MGQGNQEELYKVVYKDGTHLASSNDTEGAFRGNLLDNETNKPVGNAEWIKVVESKSEDSYLHDNQEQQVELSPEAKELAQLIGVAITAGTIWAINEFVAPHIKHWWQEKAMPTMKVKWNNITDKKKEKNPENSKKQFMVKTTEIDTINGTVPEIFYQEIDEVYDKYLYDITSEEAQSDLLDIFILSAMLTVKVRKLQNARIIKTGIMLKEYEDSQEIIKKLATTEYVSSINLILKNNPSLLLEKSTSLCEIFGRSLIVNGEYIPFETEMLKRQLTL